MHNEFDMCIASFFCVFSPDRVIIWAIIKNWASLKEQRKKLRGTEILLQFFSLFRG